MRFICHIHRIFICLLLVGGSTYGAVLPPVFTRALHDADIPLDAVALVIQPIDTAQPILSHRATKAMNPASVMKLVTSLAALDKLGPAYTWKTEIWALGDIQNRTLNGDLVVKGYGDPTLTLERMWLLQRELRARGIETIYGNLILDNSYFALPALDPGALDGEPLAIYNALPAALLANYNATAFKFSVAGDTLMITPELKLPALTVTSHLALDNAPCGEWKDRVLPAFPDTTHRELIFEGSYARDCGEKYLILNAYEASRNFDYTFRALWRESGGVLSGSTQLGVAPTHLPPLLSFSSIPLAEALRHLNKYSNNLMTRNLFLTLGAEDNSAPATLEKSSHAIHAWLANKQIAAPELVLENGAGLSRNERISAQTLSRVLLAAYRSPYFSEFESALPILGIDGTLRRRFTDSALVGRAHMKTGTLNDARALAGYVLNRDGKRMVFVMLVNHPRAEHAEAAQRALLDWTYSYPSMPARLRRGKK
jgi:D-alanyl-D-alanine carboxypeptidase/D-alanyl-D-alanine-endopeptidase (penicillin-binding protein 4)